MLRLAQAASSEFGTKYGTPPNQLRTPGKLDGELNVVNFYGGWQYVFRPKDEQTAERIADFVLGAVENGAYIGYGPYLMPFSRWLTQTPGRSRPSATVTVPL